MEHTLSRQRGTLDLLRAMNEQDLDPSDTELSARIASYELAFRMQGAAPEAVEIIVLTFWRSLDAIRGFAGADLEGAVVAVEAAAGRGKPRGGTGR